MTEQEREEMLKDRKELAKSKGVSYLELYCGKCEHGKCLDNYYVTCEALFNHIVEYYSYCNGWTKRKDLVEVVRCKDCKFNYGNEHNCEYNHHDLVCTYWESDGLDDDDFCSQGERMDEVEE